MARHSSASDCLSARVQDDPAVALHEVTREEVELPRQLLDVERHPVGQIAIGLRAPARGAGAARSARPLPGRAPRARPAMRRRDAPAASRRRDPRARRCRRDPSVRGWPAPGSGTRWNSSPTLANGSVAKSIGPACSASTTDSPSARRIRKYRRSEASPVSGTILGSRDAKPLSPRKRSMRSLSSVPSSVSRFTFANSREAQVPRRAVFDARDAAAALVPSVLHSSASSTDRHRPGSGSKGVAESSPVSVFKRICRR